MSFKYVGLAFAMVWSAPHAQAQFNPCDALTSHRPTVSLSEATELALAVDLRSDAARYEIAAARTATAIAALRPADTVALDIEDFPGIGMAGDIDSLQVTGRFSRVWERGGKREARQTLAYRGVGVAESSLAAARYSIAEEVQILYAEASIAQQRVALACEHVDISLDREAAVKKRVDAARDPLLSGARAASDRMQAEADARRYAIQADNILAALGAYWGAEAEFLTEPDFLETRKSLRIVDPRTLRSPEIIRLEAKRLEAIARIELERTRAKSDVTWSVGVRKYGIEDDIAVIGGASIPLGAQSRSAASVAQARAEQRRIEIESEALRQQLLRRAVQYQRSAASALTEIDMIDAMLLPGARRALDLATEGYARGALSYLDIIDAQRTLTVLREERLSHLRTYILSETALARLTSVNDTPSVREEIQE
ncbi:MAG: TolC family protein [Alphaproteobacteria bacterium]|nr:TolC family protein [Alphaproteobacteria bacterium]MBU2082774.1 TolC family protein [Alphaproteobacteria bacterium]MBU2143808.1 TolC family protein [Alphaproteobacteria bacterium]MBU2196103.1 TolC family protein [Alphaproteobacteria bacterium]